MILEKIKTPGLAQIGYLIGDGGEAAVIDPRRDVDAYLDLAARHQLTIRYVVETHRQEDFVMGSAELARLTGASIVNGRHPCFGRGDLRLGDGDTLAVGGLRFRAFETPGHTPESMSYAVFVADAPDAAWAVFTGDALFVGETGRTDLPDPLATGENAGLLYDAIHAKLRPLGDQALVLPAHGSGSVCGGRIANRDETTMGLELLSNPVFRLSRSEFIASKVNERIPRPPYFEAMERVNLHGGTPLKPGWDRPRLLTLAAFDELRSSAIVIDARDPEAFAGGHVPHSINVWQAGLPVFGGWIAGERARVLLILQDPAASREALLSLARVGIDHVEGILAGGFHAWRDAGRPIATAPATTVAELRERGDVRVLDVRDDQEYEAGHHPLAAHLYVGYVPAHLDRIEPPLRQDEEIAVTCSVGHRAGLATSLLRAAGYCGARNLLGGMTAWQRAGGVTEEGGNRVTTPSIEGPRR